MNSYDNMVKTMSAVKAYGFGKNSFVESELKAYAVEFDRIAQQIDKILSESLVLTAKNDGLIFYEKLVGSSREDLDTDTRRDMIISLMNLNTNDNTLDGIKRFFKSLDFECEITENPPIFDLYIKPVGGDYSMSERQYIIKRAKEFLPCHLTFTIEFRTSTWADYDGLNRTFGEIDALNLTWEKFESTDV